MFFEVLSGHLILNYVAAGLGQIFLSFNAPHPPQHRHVLGEKRLVRNV